MSNSTKKNDFFSQGKNLLIVGLAIALMALSYFYFNEGPKGKMNAQEATDLALQYINENLLGGEVQASLNGEIMEESGVYKFNLSVDGQNFDSYITKDGKLLFPQAIAMQPSQEEEGDNPQVKATCEDLAKTEAPQMEAFVASYCSFGTQMQRIIAEIVSKIPEMKNNIKIKYMGWVEDNKVQSMKGELEATENLRQICIREEQSEKFYPYLNCFLKAGEAEKCLTESGVNVSNLQSCMNDSNRGVKYAQVDFTASDFYGVKGSPTLVINGQTVSEYDFGGRTAESVKKLTCCGYIQEPSFCSQALSAEQVVSGFSQEYAGQGSGSCD